MEEEMYLWSIQEENVWELIQDTGIYRCDPYKSDMLKPMQDEQIGKALEPQFENAYEWLAEQMEKRVGPKPAGVRFPVWAWYQYSWKRKPDLRKERWSNGSSGERMVCMELDVPDDLVLLSDFNAWHFVLNRWPISDSEEESDQIHEYLDHAGKAEADAFLLDNWKRARDITPSENNWIRRGEDVQATFWELKREYVKKVRPFIVGTRKDQKPTPVIP